MLTLIIGSYDGKLIALRGKPVTSSSSIEKYGKEIGVFKEFKMEPLFSKRSGNTFTNLSFDKNGSLLIAGESSGDIGIIDLKKMTEKGTLSVHSCSVIFSEFVGRNHLVTGALDSSLIVTRVHDWTVLGSISMHRQGIINVSIHPTGRLALTVGKDKRVKMADFSTKRIVYSMALKSIASGVLWSRDGTYFVIIYDRNAIVYMTENGNIVCDIVVDLWREIEKKNIENLCHFEGFSERNPLLFQQLTSWKFISDRLLVVGTERGFVYIVNVETRKVRTIIQVEKSRVKNIEITESLVEDYVILCIATSNGNVYLYMIEKDLYQDCEEKMEILKEEDAFNFYRSELRITTIAIHLDRQYIEPVENGDNVENFDNVEKSDTVEKDKENIFEGFENISDNEEDKDNEYYEEDKDNEYYEEDKDNEYYEEDKDNEYYEENESDMKKIKSKHKTNQSKKKIENNRNEIKKMASNVVKKK